jgi:N-acetylglucosaminyl-diphospho-decaprenol L-rhamnosyltransferase
MTPTGIVIVTYNSEAHIGACLDAAIGSGAEIVVVDNASSDGTIAEVARRGVRLIANSANLGFAAAVNQGFAVLESTYVLLLNPDSVLTGGLEAMREACELPRAAGAGGCLLDDNRREQTGFMVRELPRPASLILEALLLNRIWPGNPINRQYRGLDLDYRSLIEVEQPAGAFLMVNYAVWKELGGFDEGFFPLWFEDVDFCRRAKNRGYRFFYVPETAAKHAGAHSISHLSLEQRRVYWYGSLLRYSAKHFHPVSLRMVCLAVAAGSFLRMIGELARDRNSKPIAAFGKVLHLAGQRFLWGSQF